MTTWIHGAVPAALRALSIDVFERWAATTVVRDEPGRIAEERGEHRAQLDLGAWSADGRLGAWTVLGQGVLLLTTADGAMVEVAAGSPGALRIVAKTLDEQGVHPAAETQLRAAGMNLSRLDPWSLKSLTAEERRRYDEEPIYQRKVGGSRKAKILLSDDAVSLISETQSATRYIDFTVGGRASLSDDVRQFPGTDFRDVAVAAALRVIAAKTDRPSSIPYLEDLAMAA